jgi:hypothetical protein
MKDKCKPKFPVGTLAYYGPDNATTTNIVAGVLYSEHPKAIIRRPSGALTNCARRWSARRRWPALTWRIMMMADPFKEALVANIDMAMASPSLVFNPVFYADLTLMGETEKN